MPGRTLQKVIWSDAVPEAGAPTASRTLDGTCAVPEAGAPMVSRTLDGTSAREKIRLRRAGNAANWPPVFLVMFETTRVPAALDCKGCLLQAIVVLEWFHHLNCGSGQAKEIETDCAKAVPAASVRAELSGVAAGAAEPQGRLTVRLIREFALVRRWPTVVYCRTRRPATVAFELLCAEGPMGLKQALAGQLSEEDFTPLAKAAGRVASAPLSFCDARHGPLQTQSIADLAARGYLGAAIVDGSLSPDEVAALERVTAEWPVIVVNPHAAVAS